MNRLLMKLLGAQYRNEADDEGGDVGGGEAVGTGNNARLAMLDRINDANDALQAADLAEVHDDGTTSEFVVKKADGSEEKLGTEKVVIEEIIDHDADKVETPQLYKFKVNGKETLITLEELTARAQKIESAEQYLADAARIRNEAAIQRKPSTDVSEIQEVDDDLALARAIQMGNEEEAVAAIRKIKAKGPSQDDLTRTIDERLTFNEAIAKFRTDFSDINSDPHLSKMARDMDAQMIADGDRRDYETRYADIGKNIRDWVNKFKPAEQKQVVVPVVAPVVDKQARKAAAESVPKASGAKAASTVEEEKEESTSDVIAGIAKARGGPQWMSGVNR